MVRLVGIEEHWTLAGVDRAWRAQPAASGDDSLVLNEHGDAATRLADLGAGRREAMEAQGVDVQVLALAPPGTQGLPLRESVALSREANDVAAVTVAEQPDRYRAMATLPLGDPAAAAAELERAVSVGLTGAMVHGRAGEVLLDDPRLDDLWAVADRLQQPIFVHPQIPADAVRDATYRGLGDDADLAITTYGWGWHVEAGTAALRLMASGALDRHPGLRLVLGHWGELLAFWHERADGVARAARLDRTITEYLRGNVWLTASGMLDPAMLRHALSIVGPDRILFSTDYPFQRPSRADIEAFLLELPDEATREAFASGTALRLFASARHTART